MKLTAPVMITPRLLPGLRIGDAWVSIELYARVDDGRCAYRYYVDLPNGHLHENDDLFSRREDLQSALGSLLSFLGACAEGKQFEQRNQDYKSDNADLFPPEVAEWAAENSDEIDSLAYVLQETPGLIEE